MTLQPFSIQPNLHSFSPHSSLSLSLSCCCCSDCYTIWANQKEKNWKRRSRGYEQAPTEMTSCKPSPGRERREWNFCDQQQSDAVAGRPREDGAKVSEDKRRWWRQKKKFIHENEIICSSLPENTLFFFHQFFGFFFHPVLIHNWMKRDFLKWERIGWVKIVGGEREKETHSGILFYLSPDDREKSVMSTASSASNNVRCQWTSKKIFRVAMSIRRVRLD